MTIIDICNNALSSIGTRSTIASLSENSAEARACSFHYPDTVDTLLRAHDWSFARRQASLALLAAAAGTPENAAGSGPLPCGPWLYEYALPVDCVRSRCVLAGSPPASSASGSTTAGLLSSPLPPDGGWNAAELPIPFVLSGDVDSNNNPITVILTNQPYAVLVYTGRPLTPDGWDIGFRAAVIAGLGARLTLVLSGDKTLAKIGSDAATQALEQARAMDANQGVRIPAHVPDWIRARGVSSSSLGWGRF